MSEIEFRDAHVAEVSYPHRTATVIVAPYETPTVIHTRARSFTEVVSRGAYDGVQTRAGKIKANRDHNWERLAGRVTALYPDRDEGLLAEVRMSRTPLGDETLELCADEVLAVSAGFALMREGGAEGPIKRGAETWEANRTVRRLNELWLDHVAFVPDPAYQSATVLDVRRQEEEPPVEEGLALPNLTRFQVDSWRAEMAAIDARYGLR
jgi:HK97 family phage prohead protease